MKFIRTLVVIVLIGVIIYIALPQRPAQESRVLPDEPYIVTSAAGRVLLANDQYMLPAHYTPDNLVNLYQQSPRHFLLARSDIELTQETFEAANRMFRQAEAENMNGFIVTSGYRSEEKQRELYRTTRDGTAAYPGASEHQTGLAFDVTTRYDRGDFEDTPQFAWLYEHCWDFGFILRYPKGKENVTGFPYESWHYRYVGVEIAQIIRAQGWTLEEYCAAMGV